MSNPSLKEQLQALSIDLPSATDDKIKKKNKNTSHLQSTSKKPAWLEYAQYGVELLKAHYAPCFKDNNEIKPLKIGIKQDLVKQLSTREDIVLCDKSCMINSLSYYVNSIAYHKSVIEGAARIDLEGHPVGMITADEARYSSERCQAKLRKRKSSKPKVVTEIET